MPDTIETQCLSCNGRFAVPATAAGKKIRCPKCQGVIAVPNSSKRQQRKRATNASPRKSKQESVASSVGRSSSMARGPSSKPKSATVPDVSDRVNSTRSKTKKRTRLRQARSNYKQDESNYEDLAYNAPNGARYSEPPAQMPRRRKKKKLEATKPVLNDYSSDGSLSYNAQRMLSIAFSMAMMAAGGAWIYYEVNHSDRIHFYPFFLIGGGFMNIARAILADQE